MSRVFADAFFYIALLNRSDAAHPRAMEFVRRGADRVVTTVAVLLEVADAMSAPSRRAECARFLGSLPVQAGTDIR